MNTHGEKKTRRRFLKTAAAMGGTAMIAGCGSSENQEPTDTGGSTPTSPPESPSGQIEQLDAYPRVKIASVSELSTGDVMDFKYPLQGQTNFLTKLGAEAWGGVGPDEDIVAFNNRCTHAGCSVGGTVAPNDSMAGPCPCHFTSFDISKGGLVVIGQATTDLPQVRLDVEDGDIYATHIDGLVWGYHDNLRNGTPIEAAGQ